MNNDDHTSLSLRGAELAKSSIRVDMELWKQANDNSYHPNDNPRGAFSLNVAENRLSWPVLQQKLQELQQQNTIPNWVAGYNSSKGVPEFREAMARFMATFLTKCPIDPEQIAISSGVAAVIELSAWILGAPGEVVVLPAPAYPTYTQDMGHKAGLERFDLVTYQELEEVKTQPALTIAQLEAAKKSIEAQGKSFRILLLTNPDNPTGLIYPYSKLLEVTEWCLKNKIHLIVNEIYGLSQIDTTLSQLQVDYPIHYPFISFARIIEQKKSPFLHMWYGLSKDLGISGFRVGVLYSLNEAFLTAFTTLNVPHMVSNHTQWLLQLLLEDQGFMDYYVQLNQQEISAAYLTTVRYLRSMQVPYVPARGSLFIWLDLSEFLDAPTQAAENHLWEHLYHATGVLLTPGLGFGHRKRGLFRLVYTCLPTLYLEAAMGRLKTFVLEERQRRG